MKKAAVAMSGVLVWAGLGAALASPARADCVEVDFEVRYTDRPSWYPLGTPDKCVVPTDWNHAHELHVEHDFTDPQPGLPSGVWLQVWVPVP